MKLYIPAIGDIIRLTADWRFCLYPESRNEKLGALMGHYVKGQGWFFNGRKLTYDDIKVYSPEKKGWCWGTVFPITFEAGTEIKIDKIYIRKGLREYNSITFWVKSGKYKGCRFWTSLSDVNTIEYELVSDYEK